LKTNLPKFPKRVHASISFDAKGPSFAHVMPMRMQRRLGGKTTVALLILACLGFGLASATGQSPADPPLAADAVNSQFEYNVKGAFLYSFGRYVEWPENAFAAKDAPFVIGIFGENPFGDVLDRIAQKKTILERRIEVRKFDSLDHLSTCNILFVTHKISVEKLRHLIEKLSEKPILLVGEMPQFTESGGDVNFFLDGDRVRFEINVDAIHRKKMQIDAKLLNLGKKSQ
jgi:hypothetical protein